MDDTGVIPDIASAVVSYNELPSHLCHERRSSGFARNDVCVCALRGRNSTYAKDRYLQWTIRSPGTTVSERVLGVRMMADRPNHLE
jgi:hypothetical protein